MSDKILLIRGARLKHGDKSKAFCQEEKTAVWTVIIRMDFEQCYIFVMFT